MRTVAIHREELVTLAPLPTEHPFRPHMGALTPYTSPASSPCRVTPVQPWGWKLLCPTNSGDGILSIWDTIIPLKGWIDVKCSVSAFPTLYRLGIFELRRCMWPNTIHQPRRLDSSSTISIFISLFLITYQGMHNRDTQTDIHTATTN